MHRIFREALVDATGKSQRIIVVFVDIRDFSSFSQRCDSADVAAFIRKVYMKIIDSYFDFASFYKSTGDGLLLTIPWEEKDLKEMSQKVIESCIKCHSEFSTLFADDPSINFEVPHEIGIGVARGSACCLISGETVIDYSGRLINLASRLTDIARPSGIVIDGAFIFELLTKEQQKIFQEDNNVYLKGIHEAEPIKIYYTPEFTTISKYNKQPIAAERWREVSKTWSYEEFSKLTQPFRYSLPSEPLNPENVELWIQHKAIISGKVHPKFNRIMRFAGFRYRLDQGKPVVSVDSPKLSEKLREDGVSGDMKLIISIAYVEK